MFSHEVRCSAPLRRAFSACVLWFALAIPSVPATQVAIIDLAETVAGSQIIFRGLCASAHSAVDENGFPCSIYTFKVVESISAASGSDSKIITVKQFGFQKDSKQRKESSGFCSIEGMPEYEIGEEYLLFLGKPSRYGFTAPNGLTQGVFRFVGKGADRAVVNGMNNGNLFTEGMKSADGRRRITPNEGGENFMGTDKGPLRYRPLVHEIRRLKAGGAFDPIEAQERFRPHRVSLKKKNTAAGEADHE